VNFNSFGADFFSKNWNQKQIYLVLFNIFVLALSKQSNFLDTYFYHHATQYFNSVPNQRAASIQGSIFGYVSLRGIEYAWFYVRFLLLLLAQLYSNRSSGLISFYV
jgi:hypothetical protein